MKVNVLVGAVLILICHVTFAATPKKLFDVALEDVVGAGRVLNVGFYGKLPPPKVVDRIVRESLDHAILIDSSRDILATGFIGDDTLSSNQYSGSLVYKASQKKMKTSWKQMKDNDGGYVFANYKAATKQVSRKGQLLMQL